MLIDFLVFLGSYNYMQNKIKTFFNCVSTKLSIKGQKTVQFRFGLKYTLKYFSMFLLPVDIRIRKIWIHMLVQAWKKNLFK